MEHKKRILVAFGRAIAVVMVLLNTVSVSAVTAAPTVVAATPAVEAPLADDTKTTTPLLKTEKRSTPNSTGTAASASEEAGSVRDGTVANTEPQMVIYDAYVLPTGRCWGYCILGCPCTVIVFF